MPPPEGNRRRAALSVPEQPVDHDAFDEMVAAWTPNPDSGRSWKSFGPNSPSAAGDH